MIKRLLTRRIASDAATIRLGQVLCYVCAGLVPLLVFRRFREIEITEAQLLIGIVATLSLALSCTVLAVLLDPRAKWGKPNA